MTLVGKFERKDNEGFLVGYSVNSKAFRVFNSRTRKVEENMHIKFLENKPNVAGRGPEWLFDIDSLTKSMNHKPVTAGNQTNNDAGIEINVNAGKARQEKASDHEFILLPFMHFNLPLSSSTQSSDDKDAGEVPGKGDEVVSKGSRIDDQEKTYSSTQDVNTTGPSINTANTNINTGCLNISTVGSNDPSLPSLEETGIFDDVYDDREVGVEADTNNLELSTIVNGCKECLSVWYNRRGGVRVSTPGFEDPHFSNKVYNVEKTLYGLYQAPRAWYETLSTYLLENKFKRGTLDKTLFIKKDRDDILLVQVYVDDIIFGSTKKSLCDEFEQMMQKGFQMSSMGELTFFLGLQVKQEDGRIFISQDKYVANILKKFNFTTVKITSTPMKPNNALIKDAESEDVDVHLYRLIIRSLMYLTASRPDIMFVVCACARKFTKGGCQFLGKRLISWQCKKQTIVASSTTEAEYVAAANYCGQVLWIQNQMLYYGFNFMNTKIYIDNESTIYIVKNPVFHSKTKHIEIRHHFIRGSYEKKLIQVIKIHTDHNVAYLLTKAFNVSSIEFGVKTRYCRLNAARNDEFYQIVDFLTSSTIHYALTDVNAAEPVYIAGDAVNTASVIPDVSVAGPYTSTAGDIFKDEMTTIPDTLMAIRSTRPRTTSVVIHNVEEEPRRATPLPTVQSQDKEQAQFEREQRIAKEKVTEQEAKDAALIKQMEDVQARRDADELLVERLQQEEREQFTVNEKARMLMKSKRFEEIQMLYEREQKWINDFVPMDLEVVNDSKQQAESSKKRSRAYHDKESIKKQKL
nr:uncharacterized mitochondrial protein AtMg00810-like [Tanacetum cinerariifolium]